MNKIAIGLFYILIVSSCRTHIYREKETETKIQPFDYVSNIKFGDLELSFGDMYIESEEFIGTMVIDTTRNRSELNLTMSDYLEGNDSIYNYFRLTLSMDTASHRPVLGPHKLDSCDRIRYSVFGVKGLPYFPLNAVVNLTMYDSVNPYIYLISGDFDFYVAKVKYIVKQNAKDFKNARLEYYDSVLVKGKFDSIYYNFYYDTLYTDQANEINGDTVKYNNIKR
ncbi:MAG: hypothetical protein JXB49_01120 [Bacteroidales bacterium]|nr:hypothetical protein [Bacteroidales bacterium]